MAKQISDADVFGLVGTPSTNYIKQISDGTTAHDLTVVNGIKFFNGKSDTSGIEWDGVQALEVVIPTLADIVANPVVLKGIINSASDAPENPQDGYLVYIGADGVEFGGQICEAGDMAVYYNGAWHVIQGENQVKLAGTVDASGNYGVVLSETAAKVLEVEGKDLNLSVNYADILGKISAIGNTQISRPLANGQVTVEGKYLTLSSTTGEATDITTSVSIDLPTFLADGTVTIADKVLASSDFTFSEGSFPTISKNVAAITVEASHNMTITASGTGDFVTGVTAIKAVALEDGDATTNNISYVTGITAASGKSFVSGIHAHGTADGETAPDFTVPGVVTVDADANTFATGFSAASDSGDVVSSISVGTVTGTFVTGLTGNGSSVLTSVTFGDADVDTTGTRNWFVTGLGAGTDVVTDVTVGATSLIADNNSSFASNAVVSATVNASHVLVFNTGSFMTPVAISKAADTITKGGLTKGGVKLTGFDSASDTLATGSVNQANTSISYKSLNTAAVSLSQGTVGFHYDKEYSDAYSASMGYKKITVTTADVVKAGAVLSNTAITANIPADTVAVGLNAGTLPSLTIDAPSATISGTVGTALTTESKSWLAVDPAKKSIAGATTWNLVETSEAGAGVIEVADAGRYEATGNVVIPANTFVADIQVSGTSVVLPTLEGSSIDVSRPDF